jgi:hypothetical protein
VQIDQRLLSEHDIPETIGAEDQVIIATQALHVIVNGITARQELMTLPATLARHKWRANINPATSHFGRHRVQHFQVRFTTFKRLERTWQTVTQTMTYRHAVRAQPALRSAWVHLPRAGFTWFPRLIQCFFNQGTSFGTVIPAYGTA